MDACVARPVSRKELLQSPPAQASMKAAWDRLRNKMVWDEDKVREWSDVAREVQKGNYEFNFGYLFGICVEKNSELPPLYPKRKFKGRVAVSVKLRYQSKLGSRDFPRHGIMPRHDGSVEGSEFLWSYPWSCG